MRLNCLPGLSRGITRIAKSWLTTCMFLLLIPLCPGCLCLVLLALGQRNPLLCMYPIIISHVPHIVILDGQFPIVLAHGCPSLLFDTAQPPLLSVSPYCLAIPVDID